jgi:hypothetical protein
MEEGGNAEPDRAALARSQVALHVTLASANAERPERSAGIDFASPRAQDVLDEFARERLSLEALEQIRASFAGSVGAPSGAPERVAYYRAVFEGLVAREPIADAALRRLVRFRAQVVRAELAEAGIGDSRVSVGPDAPPFTGDGVLVVLPLLIEPAMTSDARLPED